MIEITETIQGKKKRLGRLLSWDSIQNRPGVYQMFGEATHEGDLVVVVKPQLYYINLKGKPRYMYEISDKHVQAYKEAGFKYRLTNYTINVKFGR